jgi:hypothetical protein
MSGALISGLAAGIFVGNLLFWGLTCHDWKRGFWTGIIAGTLTAIAAPFAFSHF